METMSALETLALAGAVAAGLAALTFWFAMIRDCWTTRAPGSRERWVWLAIVVLGKLPGALAYYLLVKRSAAAR